MNTFEVEIELNVHEYLGHARQSEEARGRIIDLLEKGLQFPPDYY